MKAPLDGLPTASLVVIHDGECALCARSVEFIATRDRASQFRFAASSTEVGRALLAYHGVHVTHGSGTMVVIDGGRAYVRSAAVLRIARRLPWPWRALGVAVVVPAPLRDVVYRTIARCRYRWFGTRDACAVPSPEVRARLL